jgi:alkanesulfonate monooxygenase SsuD/methylene tetrahydromethanopterin reductase-like flavin-dependent oxidoreductase (luciferase family)
MAGKNPIGLVLGSSIEPQDLAPAARNAEDLGFGELWFAEDYFFTGGISGATAALGATREIPIGFGIVSALVRHPALLAMEVATIERMYPGRLVAGIGVGVPGWMQQMGILPSSPLSAVRECVVNMRALLEGETVDTKGRIYEFNQVTLTHPPDAARGVPGAEPVPIRLGPIGPKMLELSGEVADGSILSVLAGTDYVRWARERIAAGAARSGRDAGAHEVCAFAMYAIDEDGDKARAALRAVMAFYFAAMPKSALSDVYGIEEELTALLADGGMENLAENMPDAWIEDLAVGGTPAECADKIQALLDAGADSVGLFPVPPDDADRIVRLTADTVLPRFA